MRYEFVLIRTTVLINSVTISFRFFLFGQYQALMPHTFQLCLQLHLVDAIKITDKRSHFQTEHS